MRAFDPARHTVEGRRSPEKIAVLSIDVEHDYDGGRTDALDRLPALLDVVRRAGLPLTAFVEGRLFTDRPDLCARLAESGADLQLHCYDHRRPGDGAASLRQGVEAFERFLGWRPEGYRARRYGLTEELVNALISEGLAWDSSVLPGLGLGAHPARVFRRADWFVIDGGLAEFPVAIWRPSGIPFTHSYRRLMGRRLEALLALVASLPTVLVYDMHMVDLVRDGRLAEAPLPLWLKGGYLLARRGRGGFDTLPALGERLAASGYRLSTLADCHARLAADGTGRCGPTAP